AVTAAQGVANVVTQTLHPNRRHPRHFIDKTWAPAERDRVIKYLEAGRRGESWMGWSTCRFCGKENGTCDLTDDVYIWPEGFAHYLREHAVKPPTKFVAHVLRRSR
ncbi:hypothetical protein, partial [Bradyrhizobium sp. NBAIM08]|uniref:hypothetical protein n=1 Tax=Bradyrhizobium sp. NBAIM08 TaxID=2793815 RepID=UPI001CD56EFC